MSEDPSLLEGTLGMILLAIVQGVTEFLPISSSGHLALVQSILGVGEASLLEDVMLHLGTLIAVVIYYRRDITLLVLGVVGRSEDPKSAREEVAFLAIATVPAVIVGLAFTDRIAAAFDSVPLVLAAMAVTGLILMSTRWAHNRELGVGVQAAILIGLAQAVAIIPGCSRSGWTIAVALLLGIGPLGATRFSFLMSIPVILGASILQIADVWGESVSWGAISIGILVSALVGWLCLSWLVRIVTAFHLHRFAAYLFALALIGWTVWTVRGPW